jgi:AcrR family transcriptional regulator
VPEQVPTARQVSREARRDLLIDAVVALIEAGRLDEVTMESVAERAGVSRPLVYRHFANRNDLLAAAYRREASTLHDELVAEVATATSVVEMYRTLVRGSLRATTASRDGVFAALRAAGTNNRGLRTEQRNRDVTTVRAFAARAVRELGVEPAQATAATVLLLGAIDPLVAQWRRRPSEANAALLEEVYVRMVLGGLGIDAPT